MPSATNLDRVQELLEEQLTEEMMKRLMAHAVRKAARLYWRGIRDGPMPGGDEANDVVMKAIMKVWDGKRNWNQEEHPDLFLYLRSVVDSDINNLAESEANRRWQRELPDPDTERQPAGLVQTSPDEEALASEEEERSDRFFFGFHEYLNDEPDLQAILDCLFDGVVKPRKIAEKLSINRSEIYNARKRLRQRLESYRKALSENTGREGASHA